MTKEQSYKVSLWITGFILLAVIISAATIVYHSYRQSKVIEAREQHQWAHYQALKNKFEIRQEHVRELAGNPDFLEHVARQYMQVASENEILFRFE
jgi:cell division protein FtsB